jgi:enamine deaminase RidA (YjgF/YER057c/UK114 family)
MTLERIIPEDLPTAETYSHAIAATGRRLVFVAGQVAEGPDGTLVGAGDVATQALQAFANLDRALAAAGIQPEEVVKLGVFVVGLRDDLLPAIEAARASVFGEHKPADTLVGVERLAHAGCLIEVDAIAVADD